MSTLAQIFRDLISVLQSAPESQQTEVLCAELASRLACETDQTALIAFIYPSNMRLYRWPEGALHLLANYGVYLYKRDHRQHMGWFIFASLQLNTPSPFAGAICYKRLPELVGVAA